MNGVEAQHLTIHILSLLSADEVMSVLEKIRKSCVCEAVEEQLRLCVGISRELREDPGCYDTLDQICKSILIRSNKKGRTKFFKKEYREALGFKYPMDLNRVEKGNSSLKLENIKEICSAFVSENRKRFWENQLLYLYPDTAAPGRTNDMECLCAMEVYKMLNKEQRDFVNSQLDMLERKHLKELGEKLEEENSDVNVMEENKLGNPPYKLYKIINKRAEECHMLISEVAEEIGRSVNTWYSWKNSWEEAENMNFVDGVPHIHLSRVDLMILAVLFDFTYPETVIFMALMGYRFTPKEPDPYLVQYLTGKESRKAEEIKLYLQKGKSTGQWK